MHPAFWLRELNLRYWFAAGVSENISCSTGCAEDLGDTFSSLSNCFNRGQLFWPVFTCV